jgi:hypothetical protein
MVSSLKELIDEPEFAGIDDPEERFTTSVVKRTPQFGSYHWKSSRLVT